MNETAGRRLSWSGDGQTRSVEVFIGHPREDGDAFVCEYQIRIDGESRTMKIGGIDGIQALQLALFMIGSTLRDALGPSGWTWGDSPGTGFPASLNEPLFGVTEPTTDR